MLKSENFFSVSYISIYYPMSTRAHHDFVLITQGLHSSDRKCDQVSISDVEEYLTSHRTCHERTMPTEKTGPERKNNRVYVDLDGDAGSSMGAGEFKEMQDKITNELLSCFKEDSISLMTASKFQCPTNAARTEHMNKLSYRVTFTKLHGTKAAIETYVVESVFLRLKTVLTNVYPTLQVAIDHECDVNYFPHLKIDTGVYNPKGRKMRMAWQNKDGNGFVEDRPNMIIGENVSVIDTLITYIPPDSVPLPEPGTVTLPSKKRKAQSNQSGENSTTDVPSQKPKQVKRPGTEGQLLREVLAALGDHRWNNYRFFIQIGFICFNEGIPLSVWEELSKKSPKNKPGDCATHWKSFKKGPLTQATLWKWLKEDNLEAFNMLRKERRDFRRLVGNSSHAEVAQYFYGLKPDAYLYNPDIGWYQLTLPSNVWKHYESTPHGLLSDIWATLKQELGEYERTYSGMITANEEQEKRIKEAHKFGVDIGTRAFCEGVIAFLPTLYRDDNLLQKMNESRHLFAFSDKVVDLRTKEIRPIRPSDYISLHAGYPFPTESPGVKAAREELDALLASLWEVDSEDLKLYVLRTIAACLEGNRSYEELYLWTGTGGNGKGLLTHLIKRAFGHYYHPIPITILTKAQDKKDQPCPQLADARGKRFVQTQEPEADDKLQAGLIKELTGGDEICPRSLYKKPITFKPQFGLFVQMNETPNVTRLDGGVVRRFRVVPFPMQFVDTPKPNSNERQIDTTLKKRICDSDEMRDAFILLLIDTFWTINGSLKPPRQVLLATSDYFDSNNTVKEWLESHYTPAENEVLSSSQLYKTFLTDTSTQERSITPAKFKSLMKLCGVESKRSSQGVCYLGMKRKEIPLP